MLDARGAVVLGRYEMARTLGSGGFGVVYEALDRGSGERVALKELTCVDPGALQAFKQEFRIAQALNHPNLVRLDALFEERGKWMIAMELVDGVDLLSYVYADRDDCCFDEEKLRAAFYDLASALQALHGAGLVHRDLKPSNVRVTPEGRLVVLDFGLTTAVDPAQQLAREAGHGTVAYMAPEQAAGHKVGPPADWYAYGACLFEALTGTIPIDAESPHALIMAKQTSIAPPASSLAEGVPADLDELCGALLRNDEMARPDGAGVHRLLLRAGRQPSAPIRGSLSPREKEHVFAGRVSELLELEQALAQASAGDSQLVLVSGESGIGKSALVDAFAAKVSAAIVLRARCYEGELLAYKAFDGAMAELARRLAQLPAAQCEAVLPARAGLLCRVFPQLAAVHALARRLPEGVSADPGSQRLEAFSLLVDILVRLSERSPIVFLIDDLQWADLESFRLLQAWLAAGEGRALIVATLRPQAELEGEARAQIDGLRNLICVREVSLGGLPEQASVALARALLGRGAPQGWVDLVARESAGHPLFLIELARYAESRDARIAAELTLDAAIGAHLGLLPVDARSLLSAVALLGAPVAAALCAAAAGIDRSALPRITALLCRHRMLCRRRAGEVSCFHDRIRSVVLQRLPAQQARALHARLARGLDALGSADPAQVAHHAEAGEDFERAHLAYVKAAQRASSSLAFAQAAALYGRALSAAARCAQSPAGVAELHEEFGHALARCGRGAEAAEAYLAAATAAQGERRTRLRIWATQHLLQSARVEQGLQAARELLGELGVPMPGTPVGLALRLGWDRAWLSLHGVRGEARQSEIPGLARMQLDALWNLAMPIGWQDPLLGASLSARYARLAAACREPAHLSRALGEESFGRLIRDPFDVKALELLYQARALCDTCDDPALEVSVAFRESCAAVFQWDLPRWQERLLHAQAVAIARCPDQPWLLTNVRVSLGWVWMLMGEHARLASETGRWSSEATDRDDQFAVVLIEGLGYGHLRHLMAGDAGRASSALGAALAPWKRERFSFALLGELIASIDVGLYLGGDAALRWLERERVQLAGALLLKTRFGRGLLQWCRARAALSAHRDAAAERGDYLLREVERALKLSAGDRSGMTLEQTCALRAEHAALRGDPDALALTRQARERSERSGHLSLARSLEYVEGILEGAEAGAVRRQAALGFFAAQGWRDSRRAISLLCPSSDSLEARVAR